MDFLCLYIMNKEEVNERYVDKAETNYNYLAALLLCDCFQCCLVHIKGILSPSCRTFSSLNIDYTC